MNLPDSLRIFERGWLSSNNVLFLGRDETALVDTGYVSHAGQTVALVRHGLGGRPLDRIVNTHIHSDHCGGNAALQAAWPCRTAIPAAEWDTVQAWDEDRLTFRATGQSCPRFTAHETLVPGATLQLGDAAWEILGAPGHDPHSVILYSPEHRILISADALWENGFGIIFPELEGESGFAETRATLAQIAQREIALVIPGHGRPFTDVPATLERALRRLDYLEADPLRNAQNAVKVLLKFQLLQRRTIPLPQVRSAFPQIPLVARINARTLGMTADALAEWTIAQLVKAGAAAVEAHRLVDR